LVVERLHDAASQVRQAAVRTLGQLHCWQAAPAIGRLLGDPVWAVRQEAGAALRSLGAPGILVLRRGLTSADRFVADMARYVLGLPSLKARKESA
jgi:HEAT repeat protein